MIIYKCDFCGKHIDSLSHLCNEYLDMIAETDDPIPDVATPWKCTSCGNMIEDPVGCESCMPYKKIKIIDEMQEFTCEVVQNLKNYLAAPASGIQKIVLSTDAMSSGTAEISLPGTPQNYITTDSTNLPQLLHPPQENTYVEADPFVLTFRSNYPNTPKKALQAYMGYYVELLNDGNLVADGVIDDVDETIIYIRLGKLNAKGQFEQDESKIVADFDWKSDFDQIVVIA